MWFSKKQKKQEHDFDLAYPIEGCTGTYKKKDGNVFEEIKINGFRCKKCDKIFWLERWQLVDLPKAMKYCD